MRIGSALLQGARGRACKIASRHAFDLAQQLRRDASILCDLAVALKCTDGALGLISHGSVDRPRCVAEVGENLLHLLHRFFVACRRERLGARRTARDRSRACRRRHGLTEKDAAQQIVGWRAGDGQSVFLLEGGNRPSCFVP